MQPTKDPVYFIRRQGVYYFRRRIPDRVKALATDEERSAFHHSFETKDRSKALELYPASFEKTAHILKQLEARARGETTPQRPSRIATGTKRPKYGKVFYQLSESGVQELATRWYGRELARQKEWALDVYLRWNDDFKQDAIEQLVNELVLLRDDRDGGNEQLLYQEMSCLMADEEYEPPMEGVLNELFRRLRNRVHQGMIHHREIALEIMQNGSKEPFRSVEMKEANFAEVGKSTLSKSWKTLDEVIDIFKSSSKRQDLREATKDEYEPLFRILRQEFGADRPMNSIDREQMRAFSLLLQQLPSHASSKLGEHRLAELVTKGAKENLKIIHPKTYNKKIHCISTLFQFAQTEQLIEQNPAKGLGFDIPKEIDELKKYPIESLQKIFSGELIMKFASIEAQFTPAHEFGPCLYWAPLIGLFTGMRSNEILQLDAESGVIEMEGIDVFKVIQIVKNFSSYRIIPLHPELKRLGFLRYLKNVRKENHIALFPDARSAKYGKYSTWFQKPFAAYLKSINIKEGRKECFHALRHNFIYGLRNADVPEDARKAMTGHSRRDSEEAFYGGEAHKRNAKHLYKLKFPGLDLSHLYPKSGNF